MIHHVLYDAAKQEAIGIKILVYHYETFFPIFIHVFDRQTDKDLIQWFTSKCLQWLGLDRSNEGM